MSLFDARPVLRVLDGGSPDQPPGRAGLGFRTGTREGVRVLTFRGEVDAATATRFDVVVTTAAVAAEGGPLVVDLSETSFIGASGLQVLVRVQDEHGALRVVAPGPETRQPLDSTGLNFLFPVFADIESALAHH